MNKEQRRLAMPESTKFIDEMREAFGDLVGIDAEENGQSVKWGVDWGKTEDFQCALWKAK